MIDKGGAKARRGGAPWFSIGMAAIGPLLLFGPMLLRGRVLYWGTPMLQFVPWRSFAFDLIRNGRAPLWNPWLGMGAPLLANYQSALLYPPNWILAVTTAGWGEGFLVLAHLVFAGAGTVLLLRRIGIGGLGQAVGGIAFASCSYLVARAGFFSLNAAASYLPWVVLASDHAAQAAAGGPSRQWLGPMIGLVAVVSMQALAGHAQTTVYAIAFALAWSFWKAARQGGRGAAARLGLMWLAAAAFAFGLAAAQLLPTAEYLSQSSRSTGLAESGALTYSFWPWRTLGLLLPGLFGTPALGDYWGYGNYWEDAVYLGILPLLMALTAAARAGALGREMARTRHFLLVAAGLAFLLALGSNTPLFPFLFRHVAFFDLFNAPTRINLISTFCLALLAGIGAELWSRPTGRRLYWTRLGTAAAGGVLLLGLAAAILPTGLRASFGRSFALAGLWLLLAGVLALLWPARVGRRWILIVAVLVTLDLVVAGWGLNPSTSAAVYQGRTSLAAETGASHRLYLLPDAERVLKFERTHRFDSFQTDLDPWLIRRSGLPNTTMLDRLASANNFDPLLPARYVDWVADLAAAPAKSRADRLALMDVAWVGTEAGAVPPWIIYRPVTGAQRARLVPSAHAVQDATGARLAVSSPDFDPDAVAILETDAAVLPSGGRGRAEVVPSTNPNQVEVKVGAPQGGWLVLSDEWYPGWVATIDGKAAPTYPADSVFRAVWVPPGSTSVVWRYESTPFRIGSTITFISLIAFLATLAAWAWVVRRRSE